MSKATKLRFALITEDVLDKLRPRSQSENARSKYMDEIYMVIRTAVNEAVDEKLQQLSTTINQMVEERVLKILEQHGFGRSMAGGSGSVGRKRERDHKDVQEKESAKGAGECSSALKLANLKRRRPKKNNNPSVTFATEEQLAKKPRTKAQKITVMPIHRENQVKNTPSTGNNAPLLPTPPPLHMDHNALDAEDDDDDNFSDVEEPSILTIAAKYLKKLEDSRRRKQQQQH
ncbi:uncharacterized protein LOC119557130 [Drosophila subpulchrella]|uniref:uncharacterized protein LOC119557130 n=1 Tax=Drosophila subpulchrella TaxID=1486046 RepID=UPI0018A1347B|nr:uncharacterized protein LOC119557130 [Drosophila subpulchrella]